MRRLIIAALFVTLGSPLLAQNKAPAAAPSADTMAITRDALKANKKAFVATHMELSEEEGKKFWPVYESFQAELDKLNTETMNTIAEFAENYETMTDAQALKLLAQGQKIVQQRTQLKSAYVPKFKKVLSGKKVARFYQLQNKIEALVLYDAAQSIPLVK